MQTVLRTEQADAALAAGDWHAARDHFEAVLRESDSPEARLGLGTALWWLGETERAIAQQEHAYAGFRRKHDPGTAARVALSLCFLYGATRGNLAAARGWAGRLARLVDQHDLAPMRGWLALCRAATANENSRPTDAEPCARKALDLSHRTGDADLELCALSELGYTLVRAGRVSEGSALLDEAMAGALGGEGSFLATVVYAGCRSIAACSQTLDVERAMQWVHAADTFTRRYGNLHLYTTCRTHYGCLLFRQGRWAEAEQELRAAMRIGRAAEPSLYGEALAKLAELRVAQGRLEEAQELLRGFDEHPAATLPRALILLRRGEPAVTLAIVRRRLEALGEESVEATALAELAVEAEIAIGAFDAAVERARRTAKVGERFGCALMAASGSRALGRAKLASGQSDAAVQPLGVALDVFVRAQMPLDVARTRLLIARALAESEPAAAAAEARAALDTVETLGAAADADETAAFLRSIGVRVTRSRAAAPLVLTKREQEVLALLGEGLANRQIAERLFLTRKTVEHHVRGLYTKLGVSNRSQAAAYAVRHFSADG